MTEAKMTLNGTLVVDGKLAGEISLTPGSQIVATGRVDLGCLRILQEDGDCSAVVVGGPVSTS